MLSPATGRLRPISQHPSMLTRNRLLGSGPVIEVSGNTICAPFNGIINNRSGSGDFIQISHSSGAILTLIMGDGQQFAHSPALQPKVSCGTEVAAAQTLVSINQSLLHAGDPQQKRLAVLLQLPAADNVDSLAQITWFESGAVAANESYIVTLNQEVL